MPTFIDVHPLGNMTEEQLKKTQNSPKDEFGITHKNMYYSKNENRLCCVLDAPDKAAVEKHHQKHGLKPEWITEVKSVA